MNPVVWLGVATVATVAAYVLGWPVLQRRRSREAVDLNAERYLAWRGRARPPSARRSEPGGLTSDERRRLVTAAVAGVLAVVGLVAFFVSTS
jgi:hypothetical protein